MCRPSFARYRSGTLATTSAGRAANMPFLFTAPSAPASWARKASAGGRSPSPASCAAIWAVVPYRASIAMPVCWVNFSSSGLTRVSLRPLYRVIFLSSGRTAGSPPHAAATVSRTPLSSVANADLVREERTGFLLRAGPCGAEVSRALPHSARTAAVHHPRTEAGRTGDCRAPPSRQPLRGPLHHRAEEHARGQGGDERERPGVVLQVRVDLPVRQVDGEGAAGERPGDAVHRRRAGQVRQPHEQDQ